MTLTLEQSVAARRPESKALARNLVIARILSGLTQHDLAAVSGVSRATIAQIEAGDGDPRLSTVVDLSGALNVSPLALLAGEREVEALSAVPADLASRPITLTEPDLARIRDAADSNDVREVARAARIGAAAARASGARSDGAALTAGLFSPRAPGAGTAFGAAFGRLYS